MSNNTRIKYIRTSHQAFYGRLESVGIHLRVVSTGKRGGVEVMHPVPGGSHSADMAEWTCTVCRTGSNRVPSP